MHHSHTRNLRPWEQQDLDVELGEGRRHSTASTARRDTRMASRTGHYEDSEKGKDDDSYFRPESMSTFGLKNDFDSASWISFYDKKSVISKVFDKKSVWTQDETLRILQDRIVLGANLWGLIMTVIFTVWFVALPKGNFY